MPEQNWNGIGTESGAGSTGVLRLALVFGAVAVGFALLVAPLAERQAMQLATGRAGVDTMSTGSIAPNATRGSYTIHRSVLQSDPNAVCIIHSNGMRRGNC